MEGTLNQCTPYSISSLQHIVNIKHAGKSYPVQLDISSSATNFKNLISEKTGVPTGMSRRAYVTLLEHSDISERMKVMVKGGILKVWENIQVTSSITQDETNLSTLGIKEVSLSLGYTNTMLTGSSIRLSQ